MCLMGLAVGVEVADVAEVAQVAEAVLCPPVVVVELPTE